MDKFIRNKMRREHVLDQVSAQVRDNPDDKELKATLKKFKSFSVAAGKIEEMLKQIDAELDKFKGEE
jgi:hypothetical protein